MDMSNPENVLKASKKGRTVMAFVTVSENPSRLETEEITKVWQTSLWNANIQAEKWVSFWKTLWFRYSNISSEIRQIRFIRRYMIDDNRAIFMFKDGSQSWEAKDFLLQQERCESVSLENKVFPGKGSPNYGKDEL